LIHHKVHDAIVIPQRSTFEILANKYVFVIEPDTTQGDSAAGNDGQHAAKGGMKHGIVRQRQVVIQEELDDIYLIKSGLSVTDKIVFEGLRQVRDGDRVEYELQPAKEILNHLKYHAE